MYINIKFIKHIRYISHMPLDSKTKISSLTESGGKSFTYDRKLSKRAGVPRNFVASNPTATSVFVEIDTRIRLKLNNI